MLNEGKVRERARLANDAPGRAARVPGRFTTDRLLAADPEVPAQPRALLMDAAQLSLPEYQRYGRQMILDGFGLSGACRLSLAVC